ncbi:MAG TPA: thioesterase family protein [Trebonia sp.]|jgi:acyl-coenzyme A thioesterase PaaI-like protein|nr:thioesterase family protein [Trebonia sp.]
MMAPNVSMLGQGLFSAVSAVTQREPGRFSAEVDPEWTIGGKPNGGYLLSMLARAATSMSAHDHVTASSAHYLHSPEPGPVLIETQLLRAGRSASQIRARMEQDGQACVEALITAAHLVADTTPYWDGGLPEQSQSSYADCPRLIPSLPNGNRVAIMEQIEVRLEPGSMGFTAGRPSGRGELRGWLALPGAEAFDPTALLFAVDAFPPATFDIEFSGWVPTLELTAYVRALPVPGPVRVLQRAQLIDAGRVDESCFVWDMSGRLVAQGTQLAGIRLG